MAHMLIVNPSKRRGKRRKSASRRRSRRPMTALQRKYFGRGRKRRASSGRRRRTLTVLRSNPIRSRRRRSFRRNPIRLSGMRANLGAVTGALKDAAIGAAGGIASDVLMAQAMRVLPVSMASQYTAEGGINYAYHGAKAALTVGAGVLLSKVAPASMRGAVARGTVGALTVQMYGLGKQMIPAEIAMAGLGYLNPGRVVGNAGLGRVRGVRGVRGIGRVGAYFPRQGTGPLSGARMGRIGASFGAGSAAASAGAMETRIGEGGVQ